MGNEITVEYALKIDGGEVQRGRSAAEFGGDKQEWDIEERGTRTISKCTQA